MINKDLSINLRIIQEHQLKEWEFDNNKASFEEVEVFYDPSYRINLHFNINDDDFSIKLNEPFQEILFDFIVRKNKDERAINFIKALAEFEFYKKQIRKDKHELDFNTVNEMMIKVNQLREKYNISKKQAKRIFIAF